MLSSTFLAQCPTLLEHTEDRVRTDPLHSIAVACAIANSYLWNRRWTFKDATDGSLRQRCLFLLQALVNIAINDAVVILFTRELDSMNFASPVVESNVAKAAAMLVSSSVSYWFMSVLVFRLRPARPR